MANDGSKYCEDYLLRKEGRSKWIQYWVVIRGVWMLFYRDRATTNRDNFRGSIELTSSTKCNVAKRGTYSFPFYISTERGTHLFKCDTNLKRHQWIYLIDLAVKGDAPAPPPKAIPSAHALTTAAPSDTQLDNKETEKLESESDDDDLSIPPGVILVTTPIEDLSRNEGTPNERNHVIEGRHSSVQGPVQHNFLSRAVLSTGITGTTSVVRQPYSTHSPPKLSIKTSAPKLQSPKGLFPSPRKISPGGLDPNSLSTFSWSRGSPDRPSSSPSPTHDRKYSEQQMMPSSSLRNNTRFSRHMASSAPDIQILSLEEPS
ncbi:uncharacterized protein LOC144656426 isoform X2 [Oculina patagonica]